MDERFLILAALVLAACMCVECRYLEPKDGKDENF